MTPICNTAMALAVMALCLAPASAQEIAPKGHLTGPTHFPQKDGASLYKAICQDCHMPDAMGAAGAGAYPALAKNLKLAQAGYPVLMVLNGKGAMPPFKDKLDDQQVAEVVNFVRGHFGNAHKDKVTPDQVKTLR
jgi:mono/diheme cytochrome c family protein